jgi:2-dehydropantoate 2-reductase
LNILVFGAGAIGTYVGGSLALTGNRVVFIEQPGAVDELRRRGLTLDLSAADSFRGIQHPASVEYVSSLPEALQRAPFEAAIFTLKSYDTAAALQDMKPFSRQLPPLLCLSNGVDNEPELAVALGADKVIPGTVTSSVGRRAVGDIVLERQRGSGVAEGHPLSMSLAAAFNAAGLNARLYPRAADMKWSKMLTNLPANATAAILDMTAAEVLSHRGLFQLEMQILRESLAVMKAMQVNVVDLPKAPVRVLAWGASLPGWAAHPLMQKALGGGRGGKMPSFHIDLHAGKGRSEVEWLNGAVVRYGEKHNVPTPVNKVLTDILSALTRQELPLSAFSRQPGNLLAEIQKETKKG